jgi:hypothetical protein
MRKVILVALVTLAAPACSSREERRQEKEDTYKSKLDPLVGQGTKESLAEIFGIPMKKESVDGNEHWAWRFHSRKHADDPLTPKTSTVGSYEELTVVFDGKGVLQRWRVTIPK